VAWEIEGTDEFRDWFRAQPEDLRDAVTAKVEMLAQKGPGLGRPHADTIGKRSRHRNLKELRVTHRGDAYRIFFAFDPRQVCVLLMGARKPDEKWYKRAVPAADRLYDEYLGEIIREGLIP